MGSLRNEKETPFGRRLLPTLLDQVAAQDPGRECLQAPRSSSPSDGWRVVTWGAMANAVNRAAHRIVELCGAPPPGQTPTIAYIGPNDVRYVVTMIACVKAGYKALLISPRNSHDGQLGLFERTGCRVLAYDAASHGALVRPWLRAREMQAVEVSPVEAWFPEADVPPFPYTKTFEQGEWDTLVVLHTSGSTGMPKPIEVRQGAVAVSDGFQAYPPRADGSRVAVVDWARRTRRAFSPMPLFHAAGAVVALAMAFYWDTPLVLGPADRPLTGDLVAACLAAADVDSAFLPPAVIEDMSQSAEGARALARLGAVCFGGGNLGREAGHRLARQGVRFHNLIGATEWAPFPTYTVADPLLWPYHHYDADAMGSEFRRVAGDDDVYELVIVRRPREGRHPGGQGVFYTFPDLDEWRTRDLYRPHPTLPDHWLYHGRADNIIVFSSGEKLNPVTIEDIVGDHPLLKGAMVVGAQRFQAGLIVEPQAHPQTEEEGRALLDAVWPLVERANEETVQHGRISRDMVALARPDKPFLRAGKGTVQRALTVQLYEDEIRRMYEEREDDDGPAADPAASAPELDVSSEDALARSITETLRRQLGAERLAADVDFFAAGIDSLGVMNASKVLRRGLRAAGHDVADAQALAPRVIYANPTPRRLAAHVFRTILHGRGDDGDGEDKNEDEDDDEDDERQQHEAMRAMHARHTKDLPRGLPDRPAARDDGQVVVLTGSTGMLGSYLLDRMGRNPRVARVVCLNRAADGGRAQQRRALADRGLDLGVLDTKAEFHRFDAALPDLGLAADVRARLRADADRVVHNAWPVNFNLPVASFEPFVAGARHVGDLAAAAARRVAVTFVSSIASAGRWDAGRHGGPDKVPERRLEDPSLSSGGYGRGKAVASLVLEDAGAAGGFPVAVVRVGQVAGPEADVGGAWSRQEWLPSIVASSLHLGALPADLGAMDRVDWTPAERVARLVLEAAGVERPGVGDDVAGYYHGVNPRATRWADLAAAVQDFYGRDRIAELVPFGEWCDRLAASAAEAEEDDEEAAAARNPGIKLLDSYRAMAAAGVDSPVVYDMTETARRCPVVGETAAVTPDMMKHWCRQWGY